MKVISAFTLFLLIFNFTANAVENGDIVRQAIVDAQSDANKEDYGLPFIAGCSLGLIGILLVAIVQPTPPTERFIGKPPEYIQAYSNEYVRLVKSKRLRSAFTGMTITTLVAVTIWLIQLADN